MSGESCTTDIKKLKLEENHKKLTCIGAKYENSVVECFTTLCKLNSVKQMDEGNLRVLNDYSNTNVPNMKEHEIVLAFKIDKVLQKEDASIKISKITQDKINVKNVVAVYSLGKFFNLASVAESSLLYIEISTESYQFHKPSISLSLIAKLWKLLSRVKIRYI